MSEDTQNQTEDQREQDAPQSEQDTSSSEQDSSKSETGSDEDNGKRPLFKRPLFWIGFAIVAVVLIGGGLLYWLHARQYESTDDAYVEAHIVQIAPEIGGTLDKVIDADNRHVKAGTLLAVISADSQQAMVGEQEANLRQAEAQLTEARAQVESAIAARNQQAAQANAPQADAAKAAADLQRYRQLQKIDPAAVAGQQLDQAQAQARSTAAQAAAARRNVTSADAQIAVARKQVTAAQAVVEARRQQIKQAQSTLGDAELRAPIAGQIANRSVNIGSYVSPGTPLMAIIPDKMWVTANFKETQLALMRPGQPVSIKVDAYPDVEFHGYVDSIQRGAGQAFALLPPQNATGNYVKVVQRVPVRIVFDTKNGPDPRNYPIGPGMSVIPTVKVR
ncbi:HlyD family secretion protein [Erythrobacter sp. LQ02-29]|uniref:HlyD family secretion protein n=1 Tax=Erythrobacter sp. LQ02-29 TaxID=2920384 RepID=UPI001F4EA5A6|nr:HlyD family secretion protein [Erythrobacter sp. LQ02-29]MCP9223822.1 HlyD family secretion protein [Erythrobacter sp. LQ02-29]